MRNRLSFLTGLIGLSFFSCGVDCSAGISVKDVSITTDHEIYTDSPDGLRDAYPKITKVFASPVPEGIVFTRPPAVNSCSVVRYCDSSALHQESSHYEFVNAIPISVMVLTGCTLPDTDTLLSTIKNLL